MWVQNWILNLGENFCRRIKFIRLKNSLWLKLLKQIDLKYLCFEYLGEKKLLGNVHASVKPAKILSNQTIELYCQVHLSRGFRVQINWRSNNSNHRKVKVKIFLVILSLKKILWFTIKSVYNFDVFGFRVTKDWA